MANSGARNLARELEEFSPGEDLLLERSPPGANHSLSVDVIDQLLGRFHDRWL
jgi:hypothetical protein